MSDDSLEVMADGEVILHSDIEAGFLALARLPEMERRALAAEARVAVLEKALRDLRNCFKWDAPPDFTLPYLEVDVLDLRDGFDLRGFVHREAFFALHGANAALGELAPREEPTDV